MGWPCRDRSQDARSRPRPRRQASLWGGGWVSRAVCSWQAIRHAKRVGGSSPTAGEEWKEGGVRASPWANQV